MATFNATVKLKVKDGKNRGSKEGIEYEFQGMIWQLKEPFIRLGQAN